MPRKITLEAPNLEPPKLETWTLTLKTITPVFGGSATPREVDAAYSVRAASVRGHLRFWWRATAGARYATPQELFKAEEEIWGSAERYGKVALRVCEASTEGVVRPSEFGQNKEPQERFFLHPYNKNISEGKDEAPGLRSVTFKLIITLDERLQENEVAEVRKTLRAWFVFGGIGGRTRRGLGALDVVLPGRSDWLPQSLEQVRTWFSTPQGTLEQTTLAGAELRFGSEIKSNAKLTAGYATWRSLGTFWARFRKGHYTGKYPTYNAMGGTMWDDHRKLQNLSRTFERISLAKPFFGLPINYQKFPNSDAFKGELRATVSPGGRMASPVILKPVVFADGTVRAMIAVLSARQPASVKVNDQSLELMWPESDRVVLTLSAENPIQAVLQAAQEEKIFTGVVRL